MMREKLQSNLGKVDRVLRLSLGALLLAFWFFDPTHLLWLIGLVPLVTGVINFCPVYRLFGVTTCPTPPGLGLKRDPRRPVRS